MKNIEKYRIMKKYFKFLGENLEKILISVTNINSGPLKITLYNLGSYT